MFMKKSHFTVFDEEGLQGMKRIGNGGKSQRKSIESEHWRFLEEIDAPMWVDLTLESKSMYQDINDDWFNMSHPFHQCSSRQLISAFSELCEEIPNPDPGLLEESDPKLPTSVSQSRGKHYKSRKWKGGDKTKPVDKQHPIKVLGRKPLPVVTRSSQVVKAKTNSVYPMRTNMKLRSESNSLQSKASSGTSKCTSSLKTNSVSESCSTDTKKSNLTQTNTSSGNSESTSGINTGSVCESNSVSTESPNSSNPTSSSSDPKSSLNSSTGVVGQGSQSQSASEVPNQIFGRTSGFMSAVKISLRRSLVTRQPSRVEIKEGQNDHNSASSKSSVGSSSSSACNLKNVNRPFNSKVLTVAQSKTHNKRIGTNVSKSFTVQDHNLISRKERIALASRSSIQETLKSKALHQVEPRKSSRVHNVQEQDVVPVGLKAKKIVLDIKVNPIGPVGSKPRIGGKDSTFGSTDQCQEASKNSSEIKDGKGLFDLKGKANGRNRGKNPKNMVQKKVYFR